MRERVLHAATTILSEQGYSAATIKTIAATAGVSVGALQHQFASKAKLMAGVIERIFAHRMEVFRTRVTTLPAARRVETLIQGAWQTASEPEFMAMLEIALARRSDAELREETEPAFHRMEDVLGRWSRRIWQSHDIAPEAALIGRRMTSAFMTGLALRAASGLDRDADELVSCWGAVVHIFNHDPDLMKSVSDGQPAMTPATPASRKTKG